MQRELVAEILANQQPPLIFQRLVVNEQFMGPLGLSPRTSVNLGQAGSFDTLSLFQAVRRTLQEAKPQAIVDIDGAPVSVAAEGQRLELRRGPDGPTHWVSNPVFLLVAPDAKQRCCALEELIAYLGPTAPGFEDLAAEVNHRSLTATEFAVVLDEVASGVVGRQRRIVTIINEQPRIGLADLIPDSLAFFERCYGPDPEDSPPEPYLATRLLDFRRGLFARDLAAALSLSLPACLRDDLTPSALVRDRSDDELWKALQAKPTLADPFSALGALDIAIARCGKDERFQILAEQAVERLASDRFDGPGGADLYVLLPPLILAVEDYMADLEGAMLRPPFWRRLCAFAHAAWLSHHLPVSEDEAPRICKWLEGHHSLSGRIRELLDLRVEPMWVTSSLCASGLRAEIIGRLAILMERHRRDGCDFRALDKISAAIEREDEGPRVQARHRPGPLEGHSRPAASDGSRLLPDEPSLELVQRLTSDLQSAAWGTAAGLTDLLALPERVLSAATQLVEPHKQVKHPGSIAERRSGLLSAGLLAARHHHRGLSDAIAARCIAEATNLREAADMDTLFIALMLAAAQSEDIHEWMAWLKPKLIALAERVPLDNKEVKDWLLGALAELTHLLPPTADLTQRAHAVLLMLP